VRATSSCAPGQVSVEREVALGNDASADIRVRRGGAPVLVENKLAYAPTDLIARLRRNTAAEPGLARRLAPRGFCSTERDSAVGRV